MPAAVEEVETTESIEGMGGERKCGYVQHVPADSASFLSEGKALSAATLLHTTAITQHPAQTWLQLQLCHHENKTTNKTTIPIKPD